MPRGRNNIGRELKLASYIVRGVRLSQFEKRRPTAKLIVFLPRAHAKTRAHAKSNTMLRRGGAAKAKNLFNHASNKKCTACKFNQK